MRHLQSCLSLPADEYHLHLVNPSEAKRRLAQELSRQVDLAPAVTLYDHVRGLGAAQIDVAIVATNSDVRLGVFSDLLDAGVRVSVLEKVLFRELSEYEEAARLLSAYHASAWVNCPRRLMPCYRRLKDAIEEMGAEEIEVVGGKWDLGCNAIHFIDLCAYLLSTSRHQIHEVSLEGVEPAKRPGYLALYGSVSGQFDDVDGGGETKFKLISGSKSESGMRISIRFARGGDLTILEEEDAVLLCGSTEVFDGCEKRLYYQSELTKGVVEGLVRERESYLTPFSESRELHVPMVKAFLGALEGAGELRDNGICPIT